LPKSAIDKASFRMGEILKNRYSIHKEDETKPKDRVEP
jgi:hypothetical protein